MATDKKVIAVEVGGNRIPIELPHVLRCAGIAQQYLSAPVMDRPTMAFAVVGLVSPRGILPTHFPETGQSLASYGEQVFDALVRMDPEATYSSLTDTVWPVVQGLLDRAFPSKEKVEEQEDFSGAGTGVPAPTSPDSESPETGPETPATGSAPQSTVG